MKLQSISPLDAKKKSGFLQGLVIAHLGRVMIVLRSEHENHLVSNDDQGPVLWESMRAAAKFCQTLNISDIRDVPLANDHAYTAWLEVMLGDIPSPVASASKPGI